jgi:hypothetical protein
MGTRAHYRVSGLWVRRNSGLAGVTESAGRAGPFCAGLVE